MCCLFHIYFRLEMMFRQKQIQTVLILIPKWGIKSQWRQLAPSTTMHLAWNCCERIGQRWVRSFANERARAWKTGAQSPAPGNKDQCRAITLETDPLTSTWEIPDFTIRPFYGHLAFETNWKGEKLSKRVPHKHTKIQKIVIFKVLS